MKNASKAGAKLGNELTHISESEITKKDDLNHISKNPPSLRDLSPELRKKEASKPIYLTRYE